MKKAFIILLLAYTSASAQVHTGIGAGYDFAINQPVATLNVGYQVHHIVIEAIVQPTLTRLVNSPNYLGASAGYNISNIITSVGGYYNYSNADKTEFNGWHIGYSLKYVKMINDCGGLFINGLYINKSFELTGGIHYIFN